MEARAGQGDVIAILHGVAALAGCVFGLAYMEEPGFRGLLLVRSKVHAERACLCQSGGREPKPGCVRSAALCDLDAALIPSWVATLHFSATTPRWDSNSACWSAMVLPWVPV